MQPTFVRTATRTDAPAGPTATAAPGDEPTGRTRSLTRRAPRRLRTGPLDADLEVR